MSQYSLFLLFEYCFIQPDGKVSRVFFGSSFKTTFDESVSTERNGGKLHTISVSVIIGELIGDERALTRIELSIDCSLSVSNYIGL